ncbi:uracil-DNA glycosylase [Candidatus Gracilibacteria bacterium]|nr:uracil-DNA glycosylase [Candidatus Gracilibacteria bacterium]
MLKIPKSYQDILSKELDKNYFKEIVSFLKLEKKAGKIINPEEKNIFRALELTNFQDIKVVILGQDPYHQQGQAHGLSFSVQDGIKVPPSLRNIYKEIESCIGLGDNDTANGNLEGWAKQGVLLLNAVLTVEDSKPASHSKIGWEQFTDAIITKISEQKEDVVFLLWGAFAKSKAKLIDSTKHLILETSHPSPLGSYRGFLGSNCFKEANDYLKKKGKKEINWNK